MDAQKKIDLIKRNTAEIIGEEKLSSLIKDKKTPVVYLGTAITGSPHIGYFVWALKLCDFLQAGFKVKILLADVHGALDNTPWDVLDKRYAYYESMIPLLFEGLGTKSKEFEFVKGSSFQLKKEYILDVMKLATEVTVHDAMKAASEVVKMGDNPKLSGLIYPLMQSLDEEYLKADVQYGGLDQRKIFVLAGEVLPKIGYEKRIHVMTPLIPGLVGKKMSSSIQGSKIDLLDSQENVKRKVLGAECEAGNPDNGIMAFLENVIFTRKKDTKSAFVINRPEKFGGRLSYKDYDELERDFREKKVHPLDIKNALIEELLLLLAPIEKNRSKLEKLHKAAYPN